MPMVDRSVAALYRLAVLVGPANVDRYDIPVDKPVAIVPPLVIMIMTEEPGAVSRTALRNMNVHGLTVLTRPE